MLMLCSYYNVYWIFLIPQVLISQTNVMDEIKGLKKKEANFHSVQDSTEITWDHAHRIYSFD